MGALGGIIPNIPTVSGGDTTWWQQAIGVAPSIVSSVLNYNLAQSALNNGAIRTSNGTVIASNTAATGGLNLGTSSLGGLNIGNLLVILIIVAVGFALLKSFL